jgi:hypothetical protein
VKRTTIENLDGIFAKDFVYFPDRHACRTERSFFLPLAAFKFAKNIFAKPIDKANGVWYNREVNEVKPLGFRPAAVSAHGSIFSLFVPQVGAVGVRGQFASVRFLFFGGVYPSLPIKKTRLSMRRSIVSRSVSSATTVQCWAL